MEEPLIIDCNVPASAAVMDDGSCAHNWQPQDYHSFEKNMHIVSCFGVDFGDGKGMNMIRGTVSICSNCKKNKLELKKNNHEK